MNGWPGASRDVEPDGLLPDFFYISHFMLFGLPLFLGLAVSRHCALSLELQANNYVACMTSAPTQIQH